MADTTKRTVAEKLAAAKKKHKAYLKEKALKNIDNDGKENEIKNVITTQNDNTTVQAETYEKNESNQLEVNEETKSFENVDNVYEADLPLPQYPMDNNYQTSSLPDPLSFFDNFNYTNVGTTFHNFAQPLTSLFNNSNKEEFSDPTKSPSQILVDDIVTPSFNMDSKEKVADIKPHELFSYDKFKADAIKNPEIGIQNEDTCSTKTNNSKEEQLFDEFLNVMRPSVLNPIEHEKNKIVSTSQNNDIQAFLQNVSEMYVSADDMGSRQTQNNTPFVLKTSVPVEGYNENEFMIAHSGVSKEILGGTGVPSSSENIQSLSVEMKEYIEKEQHFLKQQHFSYDTDYDRKNQELFSLLEQQNAKCVELSQKLYESEMKYTKLFSDYQNLEMAKQQHESVDDCGYTNDVNKLRDDLQCHLQTIGMLVAEKTELTTLLQETQSALRNESSQCIDLQNEIKELKIHNSSIENELKSLKSEKMNVDSSQREQANIVEKIHQELDDKKIQFEELRVDLLESREKLIGANEINEKLQKEVLELKNQLSMANIKIQQLTLQEPSQLESQLLTLAEEKRSYEKQISMLNESLKSISNEREESSLQYQHYVEQLNTQISNLIQSLEQQQKENEQMKIQEEHRIKHIGDLEKQIQNINGDNTTFQLQRNNSFLKKELESSTEMAQNLQKEKEDLNNTLSKILMDKELLEKELENSKITLVQLESTVDQLRGSQPDNAVLLATMESDKVAASRAMSQNNELKKQMEGMQEVMMKVNNDNVQLTEIVSLERKTNKELFEKLQRTEISFQTLADAIEIKDKELIHLRDQIEKMSRQIIQQEHLSDRLRHYEAQNNSSPSLQTELQEARQMIAHLTNELNILKRNQLNQTTQMNQTVPINQINQMNQTVETVKTDQTSQTNEIHQINITSKIDQISQKTQTNGSPIELDERSVADSVKELKKQLEDYRKRNQELELLLENADHSTNKIKIDTNGNETLDKETAMMHLEKKFLRTMEELARLTEEKQRLEHLVLQLQGETETIGEYVTLYQQQRSILKQKALEKDQQLLQLTNDRETIKANLDRLNQLVKKLIITKGEIPQELLDQHEHFSKERDDLCFEHQKIHQEINKLTSNGLNNSEVTDKKNTEIADEIITLLSEIKSNNLIQPNDEGLHHCPWCSGKLITV